MSRLEDIQKELSALTEAVYEIREALGVNKKKSRSRSRSRERGRGKRRSRSRSRSPFNRMNNNSRRRLRSRSPVRRVEEKKPLARDEHQGYSVFLKFPAQSNKTFKSLNLGDVMSPYGRVAQTWVFFDRKVQAWVSRVKFEDEIAWNKCQQDQFNILRTYDLYITTQQGRWPKEEDDKRAEQLVRSYSPREDGECESSA